jgi:hypothetical protein
MTAPPRRFYVIPSDDRLVAGFERLEGAEAAALAFGEGTFVVDTEAPLYQPMLHRVENGVLAYLGFGGWGTKAGRDGGLIEAVRKGHPALVRAFLAKGADPDAADGQGGTALIWAVAVGREDVVRLLLAAGADPGRADDEGTTALALAERKDRAAIAGLLRAAG